MSLSERYYEIALWVYEIVVTCFAAYSLVVWTRPFLSRPKRAWTAGCVYAGMMFFLDLLPFSFNVMLVYGTAVFAAFLVTGCLERECLAQKLFLAVTFFCVRWQSWRIVSCVSNEMLLLTGNLFSNKSELFLFWMFALRVAGDALLGCLIMYGMIRLLLWSYGTRREQMNVREFLLLVVPSVSGVFSYGVFRYFNYIYERDAGKSPFDLYGSYDLMILLYSVICFVVILVTTYVFRQWKNEKEEETRREVFLRQMQDLRSHIAQVEHLYSDMRSLRHDLRNHLTTLEQLYGRGAYEEARAYARSLVGEVREASFDEESGNPVTDVILSGRKREMQDRGIRFDCEFRFPQDGTVDAFDISIILNNALENALEAIEREQTACAGEDACVSLSSRRVKNMYLIEVANSFAGELPVCADGLPVTSKSGEGHGFGLANIRRVAKKYYGELEIGTRVCGGERLCVLRVMLQLADRTGS